VVRAIHAPTSRPSRSPDVARPVGHAQFRQKVAVTGQLSRRRVTARKRPAVFPGLSDRIALEQQSVTAITPAHHLRLTRSDRTP
jgi:hypothetical protein